MNIKSLAKIYPIRLFKDNYSYMIVNPKIPEWAILVDPADPHKVVEFLQGFKNLRISQVLFTHKHWDHIGDPILLRQLLWERDTYKELVFVASKEDSQSIPDIDIKLDKLKGNLCFNNFDIEYHLIPCHTKGHLLYHFKGVENVNYHEPSLSLAHDPEPFFSSTNFCFTGDTLFIGGCGRFFEGNAL